MASTSASPTTPFRKQGTPRTNLSSSSPSQVLKFSFTRGNGNHVIRRSAFKYVAGVVDEEMERIRRLQNGSDVSRGGAGGREGRTVDLTPAAVEAIVESFGEWVAEKASRKDPRISGASLSTAVVAGLMRAALLDYGSNLGIVFDTD